MMDDSEFGEEKDSFEPLNPAIETAPHPPRDTMTVYPGDILPPLKDHSATSIYPRSSSHSGLSAGSGSNSGSTSPGGRSPLIKSNTLSLDGKHSPRRRNSVGATSGSSGLTPMGSVRTLESPCRSPQMNHGSLLHHEHSTPNHMDLLPPTASPVTSSISPMHGGKTSPHDGSPSTSATSSPPSASPQTLSLSSTAPLTPTTLAATLPSLSARRNSKPLLWSGANAQIKSVLANHTVGELIRAMPKQEVVEIDSNLSPYEGFEILLKHNILAAPVYDSTKKEYTGFLDVRDLVSSVIFAHEEQLLHSGSNPQSWTETWMDVAKKGLTKYDKIGSASITYLSRRSPFRPVNESHPLIDLAKALATRVHRVPVVDDETKKCVYICSQSSLIQFLIQHKQELNNEWRQSIGSLTLGLCKVISVSVDSTAWTAFKLIEISGVSGIAVVDREGKLVGNTSAKDLKLFMMDRGNLSLDQPILEYLANIRQREFINEVHPSCSVPVTASIGHVIELMGVTKYHRVFITDKESRPIGVLSLSDVLKFAVSDAIAPGQQFQQSAPAPREMGEHRGSLNSINNNSLLHSLHGSSPPMGGSPAVQPASAIPLPQLAPL